MVPQRSCDQRGSFHSLNVGGCSVFWVSLITGLRLPATAVDAFRGFGDGSCCSSFGFSTSGLVFGMAPFCVRVKITGSDGINDDSRRVTVLNYICLSLTSETDWINVSIRYHKESVKSSSENDSVAGRGAAQYTLTTVLLIRSLFIFKNPFLLMPEYKT